MNDEDASVRDDCIALLAEDAPPRRGEVQDRARDQKPLAVRQLSADPFAVFRLAVTLPERDVLPDHAEGIGDGTHGFSSVRRQTATVRGDRLVDASQLSRRAVLGIAFEVVPTESVIPRQMTDEGTRRQPFRRKSLPLCIYKVARMETTLVDEIGDNVKGVVHVV